MKRISIEKKKTGTDKYYFLSNIGSWITKMLKINERELRKRKEIQKMLQIIIKSTTSSGEEKILEVKL